jgi:hypothetical protein
MGIAPMTINYYAVTLAVLLPALLSAQNHQATSETYDSVVTDAHGRLVIRTSKGRTIIIPKDGEQASFGDPVVSANRSAVGAQALFPNCCTSYDLPLQLVVYSRGTLHRFRGVGFPIFRWNFADAGTRVAFGQEPAHFGCAVHYELRDIHSERLIDAVDVPQPCGDNPNPKAVTIPRWVSDISPPRQKAPLAALRLVSPLQDALVVERSRVSPWIMPIIAAARLHRG